MTEKNQEKDNTWMYFAIFALCYMGFFVILGIVDDLYLNHIWGKFLCDNGFTLNINSSQIWCDAIRK